MMIERIPTSRLSIKNSLSLSNLTGVLFEVGSPLPVGGGTVCQPCRGGIEVVNVSSSSSLLSLEVLEGP